MKMTITIEQDIETPATTVITCSGTKTLIDHEIGLVQQGEVSISHTREDKKEAKFSNRSLRRKEVCLSVSTEKRLTTSLSFHRV